MNELIKILLLAALFKGISLRMPKPSENPKAAKEQPQATAVPAEAPAAAPTMTVPSQTDKSDADAYWDRFRFEKAKENIYNNPRVLALAQQCKAGNTDAMLELSGFFRQRCSDPLLELLDKYESDPSRENESALHHALSKKYWYEAGTAEAYMMWLYRAGLYGDKGAADRMERYRFYKNRMLIPERVLNGDFLKLTYSTPLFRGGIMDIPEGILDCGINYNPKTKKYIFSYVCDYIPADEDGFGREDDYACFYLDEFFNRIPEGSSD